ncbi:antibiotic biosynthesis monooxygenase [Amycolatopsis sp. FDAARGOS 1241]|uniref:antibiotic biosynthesis monooxygenase family protein n=1 Tax=Amycolatopsis sp. FDAARGOS 1241 TaxID=2778070 RepID=UPI0019502DC3|nr:antibiotic biosynthesis monooxygenase [Amycolatopsis sp. FDAARGOS 1241]QRP45805.1 antibiotic biosynthesis monooxygenase [Amycolatopsis sp. FDAARGOS 1241]
MHRPEPPYYAVIFTSRRTEGDNGYGERAARMSELAAQQHGYLGETSVRDPSGLGITVSYWRDEAAIAGWRKNVEHTESRRQGRRDWYEEYDVRVARVERSYGFSRGEGAPPQEEPPNELSVASS